MKQGKKTRGKRSNRTPTAPTKSPSRAAPAKLRVELKEWQKWTLIFVLGAAALGWLIWSCTRNPEINFLSRNGAAEWILFPRAMEAGAHRIVDIDTVFRREFSLGNQLRTAHLELRAAKRAEVRINGTPLPIPVDRNWKDIIRVEITPHLRPGNNSIEARVINDNAPPALWLNLSADQFNLRSDKTWEASCAGSAWRSAALAEVPRLPGPGNVFGGGETMSGALRSVWIAWLIFAAIAAGLWIAGRRWLTGEEVPRGRMNILLFAIVALWFFLFCNNARLMPFLHGFDSQDHLNYISYVQERHALPLPTEGFEMFQPPLYYIISAVALSLCGQSANDPSAILILRFLTFAFGVLQFALVFMTVRLFFPNRIPAQLLALGLAAFLPMQLYLSHYVTNETLAATLVTASVYLGLRLLRTDEPRSSQFVWLGLCMGAAMLTKATALLVVAPLFLALIIHFVARRAPAAIWLRHFGTLSAVFAATCGWHYLRIWRHFGTPVVGNWDAAAGFPWWQDPGFHNAADYFRFGKSFVAPLYSGFWSFADGIYSTLWGDALCGGVPNLAFRPPWNYNLMIAGYLLALIPTVIILVGAGAAFWRFVRKPSLDWFVLFGFTGAVALGLTFMTFKVASYAQVKAFYGLAMLVPICFFGVIGWEVLTRGQRIIQGALAALLLFLAVNSFASYWVVRSPSQQVYAGMRLGLERKVAAATAEATQAIDSDPANAPARRLMASLLSDSGRFAEALPHAQRAIELSPLDDTGHLQLAMVLAGQGQMEAAVNETRRALELGPENVTAYNFLLASLSKLGRSDEFIKAAGDALAVAPFSFDLHHTLAVALGQKQDLASAADHFIYALLLQPDSRPARANFRLALRFIAKAPEASKRIQDLTMRAPNSPTVLSEIAWIFATHSDGALRNGPEAVRLAERAAALSSRANPGALAALAAAYAETNRIPDAIKLAQEARLRAQSIGDAETIKQTEKLLAAFQANRAYHE